MKINRNDTCTCGSGKKYKHCCYDKKFSLTDEGKNKGLRYYASILLIIGFLYVTAYGIYEFYQEDRPEMEAYKCDNPRCGKIHYRPISSQNQNN